MHGYSKFCISLYRNEPTKRQSGAWVCLSVHSVCAQNNSLISNTTIRLKVDSAEIIILYYYYPIFTPMEELFYITELEQNKIKIFSFIFIKYNFKNKTNFSTGCPKF